MSSSARRGFPLSTLLGCALAITPQVASAEGEFQAALRVNGEVVRAGEYGPSNRLSRPGIEAATCISVPFCSFEAPPSTGACGTHGETRSETTLIYYITSGGLPVPNCPVAIELFPRNSTGGHCHTSATRPVEYPAGAIPRIYTGNTGADGLQFQVLHVWPEAAGAIDVVFYSTDPGCPFYNDHSIKFILCVGTEAYPELPAGANYTLIGSTTPHPSPNNHYGSQRLIDGLVAAADGFHVKEPTVLLDYNDMSLPWGGAFDLNQNWQAPHCSHRLGVSSDIRISTLSKKRRTILEAVLKKNGFGIYKEDALHWHVTKR